MSRRSPSPFTLCSVLSLMLVPGTRLYHSLTRKCYSLSTSRVEEKRGIRERHKRRISINTHFPRTHTYTYKKAEKDRVTAAIRVSEAHPEAKQRTRTTTTTIITATTIPREGGVGGGLRVTVSEKPLIYPESCP